MRVWGLCVFLCIGVLISPLGFSQQRPAPLLPFLSLPDSTLQHKLGYVCSVYIFQVCVYWCVCNLVSNPRFARWPSVSLFFYCCFTRRLLLPVNQSAEPQEFKPLFIHHALSSISSLNSKLMCVCTRAYACIQDQCQKDAGFTESNRLVHKHIHTSLQRLKRSKLFLNKRLPSSTSSKNAYSLSSS